MAKEIGRIGQFRYYSPGSSSIFFEEFLRELQGIKGVEAYQEKASHPAPGGPIREAIQMPMRHGDLHI